MYWTFVVVVTSSYKYVVRYNFWIDEWHMKELRVWVSEINFRREIFFPVLRSVLGPVLKSK